MAEATNVQMQSFCDQWVRPFWERFRGAYLFAKAAKALDDDEYARAAGTNAWSDARTDGPPHLLQAGNSANPDDVLNANSGWAALITILEGTDTGNDASNAAALRTAWGVGQRACVQPPSVFSA